MLTLLMYVVFVGLVAAALFFVASAIFGRGEELGPLPEGTTATVLPAEGITGADVRALRFQQVVRGYKAAEVDWALARLAARIDELQIELAQARAVPGPRPATAPESRPFAATTDSAPALGKDDPAGYIGTTGPAPSFPEPHSGHHATGAENGSATSTGYRYPTAWSATGEPELASHDDRSTPAPGDRDDTGTGRFPAQATTGRSPSQTPSGRSPSQTPTGHASNPTSTERTRDTTAPDDHGTGWGTPLRRDEPAAPAPQPGTTPSADKWGIPFNLESEPAEGSWPHRTSGPS